MEREKIVTLQKYTHIPDMHYTLFELNNLVRKTIEQTLSEE